MQLDPTVDESFLAFLPGRPQEDDSSLVVEFFVDKKLLGKRSIEEGREIYEDREYVRVQIKGQSKQVVVQEVKEQHIKRFPIAYYHFKAKRAAPVVGTPIEQLPHTGPTLAASLKVLGIRTIEDLANANDSALGNIGPGSRELQNKAKAFLGKTTETTLQLSEQLATEKARNDAMAQQLADMQTQLSSLSKPRRGRPPKATQP